MKSQVMLNQKQADRLAKRWFGDAAEAIDMEGEAKPYTIGVWEFEAVEDGDQVFTVKGVGDTWPSALRDADPRRFRGFIVSVSRGKRAAKEVL